MSRRPGMRRKRLSRRVIATMAVLGIILATLLGGLLGGSSVSSADRQAISRYADAIQPLAVDGGRIVQQEIKPRITDLRGGTVSPQQFGSEAQNWLRQFQRIRREFAAAPRPKQLQRTTRLYDEAFDAYIRSIEAFIAAAALPTAAERDAALAAGAGIAEQADKTYDRARAELAEQMTTAGLDPPPSF